MEDKYTVTAVLSILYTKKQPELSTLGTVFGRNGWPNSMGLGLNQQSRFTEQTYYRLQDSGPITILILFLVM